MLGETKTRANRPDMETFCALWLALWGALFAMPTFRPQSNYIALWLVERIPHSGFWCVLFLFFGLSHLWAIRHDSLLWRQRCCALEMFFFGMFLGVYVARFDLNANAIPYTLLAPASIHCYYRLTAKLQARRGARWQPVTTYPR